MLELYQNIRNRRKELGMSQDELAKKVGYTSRSTIARIENGEIDISRSKIIAFAEALKTTPMDLLGWSDDGDILEAEKGLPNVTLHGLRHTYASLLHSQGVGMAHISAELGHSNLTTTANIYTHIFQSATNASRGIANTINNFMLPQEKCAKSVANGYVGVFSDTLTE